MTNAWVLELEQYTRISIVCRSQELQFVLVLYKHEFLSEDKLPQFSVYMSYHLDLSCV